MYVPFLPPFFCYIVKTVEIILRVLILILSIYIIFCLIVLYLFNNYINMYRKETSCIFFHINQNWIVSLNALNLFYIIIYLMR